MENRMKIRRGGCQAKFYVQTVFPSHVCKFFLTYYFSYHVWCMNNLKPLEVDVLLFRKNEE